MTDSVPNNTTTNAEVYKSTSQTKSSSVGEIDTAGDRDWFKVTLPPGRYYIDLKGSHTGDGTLNDPLIGGIYDFSGRLIEATLNDDSGEGRNSQTIFEVGEYTNLGSTYYIEAAAYGNNLGTYTLSVTADDYKDSIDTLGEVSVGSTVSGFIETFNDTDWFKISLDAMTTYVINLRGDTNSSFPLVDPVIQGIVQADGTPIDLTGDDNSGAGKESLVNFTPSTSGDYFIRVGTSLDPGQPDTRTGNYRLSVQVDDHPNSVTDSSPSSLAELDFLRIGGDIEQIGDQDWFSFTMAASETYEINLTGSLTFPLTLSNPNLMGVYDASGLLINGTENEDGDNRLIFKAAESGTYYIAASSLSDSTGTYDLYVNPIPTPDDYPEDSSTTAGVLVGRDFSGEIGSSSDQDWVAVTLQAGTSYQFDMVGTDTSAGTLTNPSMTGIYDANGVAVTGFDSLVNDGPGDGITDILKYSPSESGTYYIAAAGFGSYLFNTGTYKLSAKNIADDYGITISTAGTLSVDGSVSAEIELAEDQDWFAVTLEAGTKYQFDLEGSATDAGTLRDPSIDGGYGPDGLPIEGAFDDDGGTGSNSQLTYTPTISGTYYLAASGIGGSTGTYKVSAKDLSAVDDYENSISTTGSVSVNGSIFATIGQSQDEDWFAVALHAGVSYTFDLEGLDSNAGTLLDPSLAGIYDSSGVLIGDAYAEDDGGTGSNSKLYYTPISSGTYYIAAEAIGALKGTYKLSVSDPFATQYTLLEDKPLILNPSLPTEKIAGTVISSSTSTIEVLETVTGNKYTVKIEGTFNEMTTGSVDDIQGTVYSITFYDTALQEVESLRFNSGREAKNVINNWRGQQQNDSTITTDPTTGNISESTTDPTSGVVTTTDLSTGTVTTTDSGGKVTTVAITDPATGIITKTDASTGIVTVSNPTTGVVTTTNPTGNVIAVAATDPTTGIVTATDLTTGMVTVSGPEVATVPLNFLANANLITSSTGNHNDIIDAGDGRDLIMLNGGDDILNGGGGIDTSVYSGSRADYDVTAVSDGYIVADSVASRDGTDTLTNVEHLFFNDGYLALENDTNIVRDTARILGALYGVQNVGASDAELVTGQIIYLQQLLGFDLTMSVLLDNILGQSPSSFDVVNLLFENLAGVTLSIELAQPYMDLLDNGTYSAIELVLAAATDPYTDNAIGLVGIVDAGLPYMLPPAMF